MRSKLYKLALWYIGKCNVEWNKRSYKNELEALDRLTYWNFGKYMLNYGADAEWQIFSRYEVLDNAIQKLGKCEDTPTVTEADIRAKAKRELAEQIEKRIKEEVALLVSEREDAREYDDEQVIFAVNNQLRAFDYSLRVVAEQLKGE